MEKKNKRKFWGTLTSFLLTFMFISSWAVLGVALALKTANVNVGGNISFTSTDVQATVELNTVTGAEASSYAGKFQTITWRKTTKTDDSTVNAAVASWTGLELVWTDADAPEAVITFTITNNNANQGMKVTVGNLVEGNKDNAEAIEVKVGEQAHTTEKAYNVEKSGTLKVTITLKVTNSAQDAKITGWNLPITLEQAARP